LPRFTRANKYRAQKCEYQGETYDSRAEAAYAKRLDEMQDRGEILWYLRQPKFLLGCPENVYRGDFLIVTAKYVVVDDVKGMETSKFRRDKKLWTVYGECPLRVVHLKLVYQDEGLPRIKGEDIEVVHGGRDKRGYGVLAPEWLRT
jgi:hypothetical protein